MISIFKLPFASLVVEMTSSSISSATQTDAKMAIDAPEKMRIRYQYVHHMWTTIPEFWIYHFVLNKNLYWHKRGHWKKKKIRLSDREWLELEQLKCKLEQISSTGTC